LGFGIWDLIGIWLLVIGISISPVPDRDLAFKVALEQYAYAPDIVDQGTQTIDKLGAEIWGSHYWFFWWD
jgi:hypothetical protein